jgi:hypothetical protein
VLLDNQDNENGPREALSEKEDLVFPYCGENSSFKGASSALNIR